MYIETLVKITDSKKNTELYELFCLAAQGAYVKTTKSSPNSSDIAHLESVVSNAFDSFAQKMFDEGRAYERKLMQNKLGEDK